MANTEKPTTVVEEAISEEELQIAFNGPAVASNRVYATLMSGGVRIAFTERHTSGTAPQFRTAVMLSLADAIALRDVLSRTISHVEPQLHKIVTEAATKSS